MSIDLRVPIPCPEPGCGRSIQVDLRHADGKSVTCPAGHRVTIDMEPQSKRDLRKLADAEKELQRTVDRINRKLRM